jgi:hypothetical protein
MGALAGEADFLVPAGGAFAVFFVFWLMLVLIGLGSLAIGIAAIINVSSTPIEAFGPWWDNTRQTWILGIAVSFVVPFGPLIAGIIWFTSGRRSLRDHGIAGRPFWAGAPRPQPPTG